MAGCGGPDFRLARGSGPARTSAARLKIRRAGLSHVQGWCGRPDLNRHSAFAPRDFRTCYGFRRPSLPRCCAKSGLGSGLYLHRCARSPPFGRRAWLGIACHRFPRVWAVLHRGFPREHSKTSSPLRLPVSPRPRTPIYNPTAARRRCTAVSHQRIYARLSTRYAKFLQKRRLSLCRYAPRPRPIPVRWDRSRGRPFRRTCSAPGRSQASSRPPDTRPNAGCRARAR
jgi:hypothetical protein